MQVMCGSTSGMGEVVSQPAYSFDRVTCLVYLVQFSLQERLYLVFSVMKQAFRWGLTMTNMVLTA